MLFDLSSGTLSFALNGKDLGVAVDGLSGPLYPAFSLYNEDDQISLLPPRNLSDSLGWCASVAERILDRYILTFVYLCYPTLTRSYSVTIYNM